MALPYTDNWEHIGWNDDNSGDLDVCVECGREDCRCRPCEGCLGYGRLFTGVLGEWEECNECLGTGLDPR